jgi:hypothetical protein
MLPILLRQAEKYSKLVKEVQPLKRNTNLEGMSDIIHSSSFCRRVKPPLVRSTIVIPCLLLDSAYLSGSLVVRADKPDTNRSNRGQRQESMSDHFSEYGTMLVAISTRLTSGTTVRIQTIPPTQDNRSSL